MWRPEEFGNRRAEVSLLNDSDSYLRLLISKLLCLFALLVHALSDAQQRSSLAEHGG